MRECGSAIDSRGFYLPSLLYSTNVANNHVLLWSRVKDVHVPKSMANLPTNGSPKIARLHIVYKL